MQVCRLQTCPLQALLGTSHNLRQRAVQVLLQPLGRDAGRQRRFDPVQWDGRIRMAHRCGDFGLLHGVGQLGPKRSFSTVIRRACNRWSA